MIGKLVETIIKRKTIIFIILVAAAIGGIFCYQTMPRNSFPKVDIPMATVTVVYPGATSEEVEKEITKKIEDVCQGVSGYDESTSQSLANACVVSITFDKKISANELKMDIIELRRKMDNLRAELPAGVTSITVTDDSMDTASLVLAVSGNDQVSNDVLSQRAKDLSDKLKQIDGVSQIKITGNNDSEVSIKVDAEQLNKLDLSLYEICTIINANNAILPIGSMSVDDNEISVSTSGRYESIETIEDTIITASGDGTLLRLRDIAEINIQEPENSSYFLLNNEKSILVSLYFQDDLNVVAKANEVKSVVSDFENTLSENVSINEVYFQSDDVKDDINNFIVSLIEAIIIVMLVVMVGMSPRNGLIVSIAIPVIIFITFVMMMVFGVQIHFVSLAALIMMLGMLVDNSIVVSDQIQVYLDEGMERMKACKEGVSKVIPSIFLSMITTVTVFCSMFTLTGTYKQVASALPYIAVISMVASFFVSILSTPVFCYLFLKPSSERKKKNKKREALSVVLYRRLFMAAFNHKRTAIAICLVVLAVFGGICTFSTTQLLPKTNKPYVLINITNHAENDLKKTEAIVNQITSFVMEQPEAEMTLSGVGIYAPRFNFSVIDRGESDSNGNIVVKLDLKKGGRFKKTWQMVNYVQEWADANVTGADIVVDELGIIPSTEAPVAVYVKGDNIDDLNMVSAQAYSILKNIDGTKGVANDSHYSTYGYYVNIDDNKRNSLGLTNAEIQNELNIAIMGRDASVYYQNGKQYNINVKTEFNGTDDLSNYRIKSSGGNKYMVKQFANVELNPEENTIKHVNGVRGAIVSGYVKNGYGTNSIQTKFEKELEKIELPDGISFEYKGEKHVGSEAITTIVIAGIISMIIIFLILYIKYARFRQVLLLFSSVPLGAAFGLSITIMLGMTTTFFAMLGILSMLGIVLANAIVLVDFINAERAEGAAVDDACRIAGEKRLTPILMSTMTTVLGFLPLALSGQTLFVAMSVLLMAALTICMIFNLVMVPTIYSMIEKDDRK
ncbi:MAG: efflux RND transporter permease subunit [Oscillospiraceae bacterium]|nr:efflux RND transporter permease subunit [Oscillospiraceae bacterium]